MQKTNSCDLKFFRIDKVKINLKFRNTKIKNIRKRKKINAKKLEKYLKFNFDQKKKPLSEMSQSEIVSHAWHRKLQFQLLP